ncbi:Asp-tRNA(Asn)/Glu-tRNA(Gln) amidotransferase subunit GatC [Cryobacterium sp. TMT1-19]|nr:Asp-tRNA(Asn)/Glu-tRNA(Gln) amidotransferase subunit GatC [Cryobacterium sp. Sr3]TFC29072.1 Asp-tRNA(Asn)/Glu-tRNA(Gln) amidotransferase subunit GatC [Cryobacterium sp. TMT2-18-2]TFC38686.1 Asp-tRNA(Asn)/Glu-tRNA(Gln) amidotransferase subunit GatC [Cryobacterium sp. TMT2-42-4]TFC50930.1 Asp-tRNA(Asn)/Glu-tRNA(Gln) amidotransferase subunit GatC [Cryobacterium sp. TMT2-17-1]TFC57045.1 Asp-tRNA(Asn)/Glu-tRNA(Gln) amidotransferase subunit GatC [Cryobacterium sp. TMT2-15-1]TFC61065.1 Asp-tRNA(As
MVRSNMSEITAEQVAHLANLARIDLSSEEIARLTTELGQIVDSVAKVAEVATPDVPATSHPMPLTNVFRADTVVPSLTVEQALSGAPDRDGDKFRVPAILDEE